MENKYSDNYVLSIAIIFFIIGWICNNLLRIWY